MGTRRPSPARARSREQTVSALTYPSLHTRTTSCVTAFKAPSTLYRRRPGAATPRHAPQAPQERRPHEVSRVDEEHGASPGPGLRQSWLQLPVEETGLFPGVLLDGLLRRHGDGGDPAVAQPQVGLEEGPDLRQATAQAGLLLDGPGGLAGVAWRVVPEVLLDGALVSQQLRARAAPVAAADSVQAAFEVLVEVALYRPQGDASELGDPGVGQAVTLQPQHFHLALDVRVRVLVAVPRDHLQVLVREGQFPHGRHPVRAPRCFPCIAYGGSALAAIRASSPRAEYIMETELHE